MQRYDCMGIPETMREMEDGEFVLYADHLAAMKEKEAELSLILKTCGMQGDRLQEKDAELDRVKAEKNLLYDDGIEKGKQIAALQSENKRLREAAKALIDDVHRRYPGEELRCPYMIALDKALKENP